MRLTTNRQIVLIFSIVTALLLFASCRRGGEGLQDRARAFQEGLQKALQKTGLGEPAMAVATERVNVNGGTREIRHIRIVVADADKLGQVGRIVERAMHQHDLSYKRFASPRSGRSYVLYEVSQGRERISAILLVPSAHAAAQSIKPLPTDEVFPRKIDLPRYFHGDYRIAIIIDDLGADWSAAEALAKLRQPITFSILPDQRFTRETAELANTSGKEVMIHLPMEPEAREGLSVGPRTILTTMSPSEVETLFDELVGSVPFAVGINNHMGSKATPDRALMMEVLTLTKQHNLFFVDSRTTPASQAYAVARELGVPTDFRSVFLDDKPEVGYIDHQLDVLLKRMMEQGSAIAIGHPFHSTLEALESRLPEFERRGVKIVFASQLVS